MSKPNLEPPDYAEKVYAGVLGKVIGVYLGGPFEGWTNERIERELGEVTYYVHERLGKPLVRIDDDISGTFTFLRALDDHAPSGEPGGPPPRSRPGGPPGEPAGPPGEPAGPPARSAAPVTSEQIGQTWLNYLIEGQTVLWWGGLGVSTEHTAWLRLAAGVPAPRSGSVEMNGPLVAEQIGAQIFIDGWAMVAPGEPQLAVELAARAGRVSHDGAAVHAACAVAAMESLAFVERDMTRLLDCALRFLPPDSIIRAVHQDVRGWAADHGDDWRKTLARIKAKYGYDKFGGGCHVVPNHAVMAMAWAHAPDDFSRAIGIAATAGWDTDCNVANVGCLMGIKEGLAGIAAAKDWQGPFADRMVIATAEGTHGLTDALRQAGEVARMGRRVMGWPQVAPPKNGARFHFSMPGSRHGFAAETCVQASVENTPSSRNPEGSANSDAKAGAKKSLEGAQPRRLRIHFNALSADKPVRVSTPTFLTPDWFARFAGSYNPCVVPTLYSGQKVQAAVAADAANRQPVRVGLFIRYYTAQGNEPTLGEAASPPVELAPGAAGRIEWIAPDTAGLPIAQIGVQVLPPAASPAAAVLSPGAVDLDWMTWGGPPRVRFPDTLLQRGWPRPIGWILSGRLCPRDTGTQLQADHGRTFLATGAADWTDYAVSAKVSLRLAESAALIARYGGLRRYLALEVAWRTQRIQLIRQFDDVREVLASAPCPWALNEPHDLRLEVRDQEATALIDGRRLFQRGFTALPAGGIACQADTGGVEFRQITVEPV